MTSSRPLTLALFFLVSVTAARSQTFPPPIGAERPVSNPVLVPAYGFQGSARVATGGDVALAVWQDLREGSSAIYGSRVDADGNPLDPAGVRIADGGAPDAVIWDGQSFVVAAAHTLTSIAPDMTITARRVFDLPSDFRFAAATTGADVRLLYVQMTPAGGNAAVIDLSGNALALSHIWNGFTAGVQVVAAGTSTRFLVLHDVPDKPIVAQILGRNGALVSTNDSGLPFDAVSSFVAAGGDDGFLVVHRAHGLDVSFIQAFALDSTGVYRGRNVTMTDRAGGLGDVSGSLPAVVRDGDRYLMAWRSQAAENVTAEVVAEVTAEGTKVVEAERVGGVAYGIALAAGGGRRFVVSDKSGDVYARTLSASLAPGGAHLVSAAAGVQTSVHMAAAANGYAVTWSEVGNDLLQHAFMRRFSPDGTPLDEAPLEVTAVPFVPTLDLKVAASADVYVVGWRMDQTPAFAVRRLDARTGQWIDRQPILLAQSDADLASNGVDALAASIEPCAATRCVVATRIPMSAAPPETRVVSLQATNTSANAALAANGQDYLLVWNDPVFCSDCGNQPTQVFAARLRADGTALDPLPLQLDNRRHLAGAPSVAATGGRYFVVWTDPSAGVRGTRVTAEGAVLDRDADRGGILLWQMSGLVKGIAAAFDGRLCVITARSVNTGLAWEGVAFAADVDLREVAAMPRTLIAITPFRPMASVAAAHIANRLALAYTRVAGPESGNVFRLFLRLFGEPARRRRAAATH